MKSKYAAGGKVSKSTVPPTSKPKLKPIMLGTGGAANAAKAIKTTRQRQMEELGLRDGGKVKRKC